ncbi:MAG: adenylate/guanylate cyclase domain-containing protein [Spirochaetia bacterium]|nr:adenylate/guanylate cyclase domain-containing protein [Spirochaetia bacterium]
MHENVKALAKYASQRLLVHLEQHPHPLDEPFSRNFQGAVLFADMQNFTILAERLTREDPVMGVKKLAAYLDIYIGRLVDIITEHGGDIVKFAGDAVFAVWETEADGNLDRAVRAAIHCGLSIQKQLHKYEVAPGELLALRVGVGSGNLHELHLGGYRDRWELLIAGAPMGDAGKAGTLADPGEVVLSPAASAIMEQAGEGRRITGLRLKVATPDPATLPGPLHRTDVPAGAQDAFNVYIPRAILVDESSGPQAELRPLTVLFCKVKDFKYTKETALSDVQIIMLIMQECIYRHEGSINRFGVDEKGAILLAAFGLPPLVHDNDPERGVLAALDIRRALRSISRNASVGVASGRAFCGTVGNDTRCEYTMHGVNVNLAARLMVNAETILCDEKTYLATQNKFDFTKQTPLRLKGRTGLIQTYQPDDVVQ